MLNQAFCNSLSKTLHLNQLKSEINRLATVKVRERVFELLLGGWLMAISPICLEQESAKWFVQATNTIYATS